MREADKQVEDELYSAQEVAAITEHHRKQMAKNSVSDPFRTFANGAPKGGLGDMFKTPDDIMFKGTLDDAAKAAEESGKCEFLPCAKEGRRQVIVCALRSVDGEHPG